MMDGLEPVVRMVRDIRAAAATLSLFVGIADGTIAARPEDFPLVIEQLLRKLAGPSPYTAAGKNFAGFDRTFLPPPVARLFRHRVLDPGSMFINWSDPHLAELATIKTRLGLDGEVAHDALEDARDVIRCVRLAPGYPR